MEPRDWIALAGIISTLTISVVTLLINYCREQRQERVRNEERQREHELKLKEKEFEVRYGKLHEKRVEAIAELYSLIEEAYRSTVILRARLKYKGITEREDIVDDANDAFTKCMDCAAFFKKNRLYFSKELADQINSVIANLDLLSLPFRLNLRELS